MWLLDVINVYNLFYNVIHGCLLLVILFYVIKLLFSLNKLVKQLIECDYSYYINFIECKILPDGFTASQQVFDYTKEHTKAAYSATFEEI